MTGVIATPRLDLVSVSAEVLRASVAGRLAEAAAQLQARLPTDWPKGHEFLLRRRLIQLEANPGDQPWLLRAILLRHRTEPKKLPSSGFGPTSGQVPPLIGLIGFHAPPDANGMVEIGYRVEPTYRRNGYATEAVQALLAWATTQHVRRFRASISPNNEPSLKLIKKLGFHQTGQQWDEEDGLELVLERDAATARPYTPVDTC